MEPTHKEQTRAPLRLHAAGILLLFATLGSLAVLPTLPATASNSLALSFLDGRDAKLVVAYAGFPGCSTSCPTALATIADAFSELPDDTVDLVFINVERDARDALTQRYAQAFHPDFEGVTLTRQTSQQFMQQLGLQTYNSTRAALAHSNHIYVFQNNDGAWRMADIIRRPQTPQQLRERAGMTMPRLAQGI